MSLMGKGTSMTLLDMQAIDTPPATPTFKPVGHFDFASAVRTHAENLLVPRGYTWSGEGFSTARNNQRMYGIFTYKNGNDEMELAIGIRNALDKSMSLGLCLGACVTVCSNGMFHGEITRMRRHTGNIESEIVPMILQSVYDMDMKFQRILDLAEDLKGQRCPDIHGYEMLGRLVGEGHLTPTLFNEAMRQWKNPEHEVFADRTAWSLYNAVTAALKDAPPHRVFEMHQAANNVFVAEFLPG